MSVISLVFSHNLIELLAHPTKRGAICYPLNRRASIKDIIEALGVPHPEVGCLLANGAEVDFSYLPEDRDRIEILPLSPPVEVCVATTLRPQPLSATAFAIDANIAKLAPLLRMIGMDCWYQNNVDDAAIAHIARQQQRILLTRDTQEGGGIRSSGPGSGSTTTVSRNHRALRTAPTHGPLQPLYGL